MTSHPEMLIGLFFPLVLTWVIAEKVGADKLMWLLTLGLPWSGWGTYMLHKPSHIMYDGINWKISGVVFLALLVAATVRIVRAVVKERRLLGQASTHCRQGPWDHKAG